MAIPKKVLEQGAEAERLAQEAGMKGAPAPANKSDTDPPATPAAPAAKLDQGKPAEGNPPAKVDPENYKERFSRMKQKYDNEVPAMREANLKMSGELEALRRQVTELMQQLQNSKAAGPAATAKTDGSISERIQSVLTDDEKEHYSPEFMAMLGRVIAAGQVSQPADSTLETRLNTLEKRAHETAEERFWRLIDQGVPQWEQVQATDDFREYLNVYDRKLKMTNGAALKKAQADLDADTAIAVFEDFMNKAPASATPNPDPEDPREQHVMPVTTGAGDGGDIQDNSATRRFTEAEITKFFNEVAIKAGKGIPLSATELATERAIQKQFQAAKR